MILNIGDFFLTGYALENGFVEGNPVMDVAVNTIWFGLIKLVVVPLSIIGALVLVAKTYHKLSPGTMQRILVYSLVSFIIYWMPYLNVFLFKF